MAAAEDIAVISYSPLGGGLLTGKYRGGIAAEGRFSWDQKYATAMVRTGCTRQLISFLKSPQKWGQARPHWQ